MHQSGANARLCLPSVPLQAAVPAPFQETKPSRDVERGRQERDFAAHEAMMERLAALRRRAGAEREGSKINTGSASSRGVLAAEAKCER